MNEVKKRWPWLLLGVVIMFLDWLSKQWIVAHAVLGQGIRVTSFFNLQLVYNRGMAFGFLNQHTGWQVILLSILAWIVCLFLLVWMFTAEKPSRFFLAALPLIMGGAIGNALDRVKNARVTDFLDFHLVGWHFWTFNIADLAITIGVICLLIDWIFFRDRQRI
jgi:signal peptidase II